MQSVTSGDRLAGAAVDGRAFPTIDPAIEACVVFETQKDTGNYEGVVDLCKELQRAVGPVANYSGVGVIRAAIPDLGIAYTCASGYSAPTRADALPLVSSQGSQWATNEDWNRHKAKITHLYWQQGKTLLQVKEIMEREDDLRATQKMFRDRLTKWGFKKNLRGGDAEAIARLKAQREADGKKTEIVRNGIALEFRRVARHLERKGKARLLQQQEVDGTTATAVHCARRHGSSHNLSQHFRVVTPPPLSPSPAPNLRLPEELQTFEEVLVGLRTWIDGNFEAGTWTVGSGTVLCAKRKPNYNRLSCANFAGYLLMALQLVRRAAGEFRTELDKQEFFRLLNLAFASMKDFIVAEDVQGLMSLVYAVFTTMETCRHPLNERLACMLWDHAEGLWRIVHGAGHPVVRIWRQMRNVVILHPDRTRLAKLAWLLPEAMLRHAGISNWMVINLFSDLWHYEAMCHTSRDADRGVLSASRLEEGMVHLIDALLADPTTLATRHGCYVLGKARYGLAIHLLSQRGREREAQAIFLKVIASGDIAPNTRSKSLRALANQESWTRNYTAAAAHALQSRKECVYRNESRILSTHQLLAEILDRVGERAGADAARQEGERLLRVMEGHLGAAPMEGISTADDVASLLISPDQL